MRVRSPIRPSIKDRLDDLLTQPDVAISISGGSTSISQGETTAEFRYNVINNVDDTEIPVDVYVISIGSTTLSGTIVNHDSKAKTFTVYSIDVGSMYVMISTQDGSATAYRTLRVYSAAIQDVTATALDELPSQLEINDTVDFQLEIEPYYANYTSLSFGDSDVYSIEDLGDLSYRLTATSGGTDSITLTITQSDISNTYTKNWNIVVRVASTSTEIDEHRNTWRGNNLIEIFGSIDAIATAVRGGYFSDIYCGDYIPVRGGPLLDDVNATVINSDSVEYNLEVVDINYFNDKTYPVETPHLVLMPHTAIGTLQFQQFYSYTVITFPLLQYVNNTMSDFAEAMAAILGEDNLITEYEDMGYNSSIATWSGGVLVPGVRSLVSTVDSTYYNRYGSTNMTEKFAGLSYKTDGLDSYLSTTLISDYMSAPSYNYLVTADTRYASLYNRCTLINGTESYTTVSGSSSGLFCPVILFG